MKKILVILALFIPFMGLPQKKPVKPVKPVKPATTKPAEDTAKNSLEKFIDVFVDDPDLKNASFTFMAKDVKTSAVIAEYNPDMSLMPASTMKVVTTAAAMEILGGGYKFKTVLQYSGYIDTSCVLHGDLYIKGGGDPTLGSRFFKDHYYDPDFLNNWAMMVRLAGIDSITGRVIGDDDIYGADPTPTTWVYGDLGSYYGAPPNGLTIFDNCVYYEFESGPNSGDSTTITCIEPYVPGLEVINTVKSAAVSDDNSFFIGPPYRFNRYVKGTIPRNQKAYDEVRGSIPDPALQAAFEFQMALHNMDIAVNGGYTTTRKLRLEKRYEKVERTDFYTQYSPSTSSIIYWINMNSVNLFAEHLCIQIGLSKYGGASTQTGCSAITEFWKKRGIDTEGLYMFDGCGLSRHNAISAHHLTDIMVYMAKSKNAAGFENTLPVAGKTGTLSNIGKKTIIAGNVHAKSGTMQRVKSYSGYVKTKSGRKLAFTMIVNNFNCPVKKMVDKFEKLMIAMASFSE
ncbi:MAG TPA: D-alanyl-D-alanine carboxypeptidase/D-alanyl-D-alanine-endopeptidase [Flavobacteriales bacterium]|nr:D-alanyl-D-alanine carboxypeptidase/D-alanyl-D-alanine-endopeptidase [Flavobacteriales bacterium]